MNKLLQKKTEFQIFSLSKWTFSFSCLFFLNGSTLDGKDFGIKGELFALGEESLISVIEKQMSQESASQTIQSTLQKIQKKAKHPSSPLIPPETLTRKTHYYDPTFITKEPITDQNGSIIFAKGIKVNPLKHIKLSNGLLFLNGDDPAHLNWARAQGGSFKWILVQGNPFKLEEQEKRPIYFDQQGFSVSKFHIQHVPARVTQEDLRLKIEEIPSDEIESSS